MKNRAAVISAILWMVSLGTAKAAQPVTSSEHATCIDKSGGVTSEMLDCDSAEMRRQDKRLNGAYQKLMASGSDAQKVALRDSQRLWLAYRKTDCDLVISSAVAGRRTRWARAAARSIRSRNA